MNPFSYRSLVIPGLFVFCLLLACNAAAKPWRDIDSIPASRIIWKGLSGMVGDDKTHLYSLMAQGTLFKPYPRKPPFPANVQAYVEAWLRVRPKARVVPVEAYPFFSATVARVYIWIVNGDENLNLHLVAEGFFRASTQVPILRTADLLISSRTAGEFRKKLVDAEKAAANSGKGIWQQDDREDGMPPGKLIFPGIKALKEFERIAESEPPPKPPLTYGPEKPEAELLSFFSGKNGPAAYAARQELGRRASSGELSGNGFNSLIALGLDKQEMHQYNSFYGDLVHLAFQQGKLSRAVLERYVLQAVSLDFAIEAKVLEPSTPWVYLTIHRKGRFARNKTPKIVEDGYASQLLVTTALHIHQIKVDGEQALTGRTGKRLDETWLYQSWRGNKVQHANIMTNPPVAPGPHRLTGVATVRFFIGDAAWNAAGKREALPEGIPAILEERYDINLKFDMADYGLKRKP